VKVTEGPLGSRVVARDVGGRGEGALGDRAEQRLHSGLDAPARVGEAGVVRGVRVGGDETARLTGALVAQEICWTCSVIGLGEDGADGGGDHLGGVFRDHAQDVAQEVEAAKSQLVGVSS
jgi:hypothetical protein